MTRGSPLWAIPSDLAGYEWLSGVAQIRSRDRSSLQPEIRLARPPTGDSVELGAGGEERVLLARSGRLAWGLWRQCFVAGDQRRLPHRRAMCWAASAGDLSTPLH